MKIIVNARNFGHIRSPHHALLQARGDAVIGLAADLQDPPEMIPDFVREWENGHSMVLACKRSSEENRAMYWLRTKYYRLVNQLSSIETFENCTGSGLYDRQVVEIIRSMDDPYPYFRGMLAEIGLPHAKIYFDQPRRKRGITKNNFYTLYDMGMLGITNLSKVPLRLVTISGFACAALCIGGGDFLSGLQGAVLESVFGRHSSAGDWDIFLQLRSVGFDRDPGGVHWIDSYARA